MIECLKIVFQYLKTIKSIVQDFKIKLLFEQLVPTTSSSGLLLEQDDNQVLL